MPSGGGMGELSGIGEKIIETVRDAVIVLDDEGRVVFCNRSVESVLGFTPGEMIGKYVWETIVPDYLVEQKIRGFERFKRTGSGKVIGRVVRTEARRKDGKIVPVELSVSALRVGDKHYAIGVVRDISDKLELSSELRDLRELYEVIVENMADVVFLVDANLVVRYVSPSVKSVLGYAPEEMVGRSLVNLVHPDDRDTIRALASRSGTYEYRVVAKDGSLRYVQTTCRPVQGRFSGIVVVMRDVSKRKKLERLLRAVNRVSGVIIHERSIGTLLQRACDELARMDDNYSAWIALLRGGVLKVLAKSGLGRDVDEINLAQSPECVSMALKGDVDVRRPEDSEECRDCPYWLDDEDIVCVTVPMIANGEVVGIVKVRMYCEPPEEEIEILRTLANDLAFGIKSIELELERDSAYRQLQRNIEQISYLIDRIRNPLAAIVGYAEMWESIDGSREKILKQASRIESILATLDRLWKETEEALCRGRQS